MKTLVAEIFRIYKKAPLKIAGIWSLDILESLIIISNPYILGRCIDGLMKENYFWLAVFIITDVVFWLSRTINKYFDTRVYSRIIEEESSDYFSKMIKIGADSSLINARLELVEKIPNFLEIDFFQILNMLGGIVASLSFLYLNSTFTVFLFALVISALIPLVTYQFQKEVVRNNANYKNLEEERMRKIGSRDKLIYGQYIKNIFGIGVSNSDLDTKIFFVTYCIQIILLFFSILSIVRAGGFTGGLLFSTVNYVEMLNDYVGDINDNLILLRDLKDDVSRLKEE